MAPYIMTCMMDADLPQCSGLDRDTLRRLARRSDARGLLQLALHAATLAVTGLLVSLSRGRLWLVPAMILYGVVLNFSFCALHETIHRTAFASRRLNDAVAWITGAVMILPPEYFRAFHFAHHRFTQDPARDPELAQPPPATLSSYLWRITGIPNWTKRLSVTLKHAVTGRIAEPFVAEAKRAAVVREARVLWACYAAILAFSLVARTPVALFYWVLPLLLGQPVLRLYLLAEHTGCPLVEDMYANTRTIYTNAAVRFLAWQMPYHFEHHAFPAVPFHALAEVNARVRDRIVNGAAGYLAVHAGLIRELRGARAGAHPQARRETV
ncbi:MAG TPA: fatty acid desaturase [Steroidobacteraceae bacterium]|nr:fatty acid desaturase [Steroidobacteraceae bacterium]